MECCKGILELCSQRERLTQPNGHATGTKAAERFVKIIRLFGRMQPGLRRRDSAPSATRTRDLLLRRHSVGVACHRPIWPDVGSSSGASGWVWPEIVLRHANPRLGGQAVARGNPEAADGRYDGIQAARANRALQDYSARRQFSVVPK